jgi:hypothetical protein
LSREKEKRIQGQPDEDKAGQNTAVYEDLSGLGKEGVETALANS